MTVSRPYAKGSGNKVQRMLLSYEHEFHDNEFWYALVGAEQKDVNNIDMVSFSERLTRVSHYS